MNLTAKNAPTLYKSQYCPTNLQKLSIPQRNNTELESSCAIIILQQIGDYEHLNLTMSDKKKIISVTHVNT
jgi:hypothetical protein